MNDQDKNRAELQSCTDEELVRMAHRGNRDAEEFLISKYKSLALYKSKSYFIAGGDKDDVVQEGMIGIFEAVRDYDEAGETSFRTFVELCVSRRIISAVRTANRKKNNVLNDSVSLSEPAAGPADAGDPEGRALEDILSKGSKEDPAVLLLINEVESYLETGGTGLLSDFEKAVWSEIQKGRNYREIAERLDRTPKSVDNAIQRIKKKIYKFLDV